MITDSGRTLNFKRSFKVDVKTLFNAWKDPSIFKIWWKDLNVAEMDCRKGGSFLLRWIQSPDNFTSGTYTDVVDNELIAFTWDSGDCKGSSGKGKNTLVTVKFAATGPSESTLELTHALLPNEDSIDGHHLGWTCALLDLDHFFNESKRKVLEGVEARTSRTLLFPVETVFEAWTNPNLLAKWFNRRNATRGKAGGEAKVGKNLFMDYQLESGDMLRVYCEVLEVAPLKKISFLWASEPVLADYDIDTQAESRVTVSFFPQDGGTKVEIVHDRLTSESAMKEYLEGWTDCLSSIEDRLSRQATGIPVVTFSPYVDVNVSDPAAAGQFYRKYFGWHKTESKCHEEFYQFGPLNIFLSKMSEPHGKSNVHFEMVTEEDIELLRNALENAGCTSCSSSMKKAYMFTDPFGNNFHVYQKDQ